MAEGKRENGTILFYVESNEEQSRKFYRERREANGDWRRLSPIQGMLRSDQGFIYAWREGHSYRDFTTPDKLQAGCRVSFEVAADDASMATGLSWHLV